MLLSPRSPPKRLHVLSSCGVGCRQIVLCLPPGGVLLPRSNASPFSRASLQLCLSRGCQRLVVFSDSMPAVETLLDTSPQSGQIFSLDACKALRPWFAGDGDRSLTMWHVPSCWERGMHKKAHDAAASVKIYVGARPQTSRDFWLAEDDTHCLR
jgi:hypothetical protein